MSERTRVSMGTLVKLWDQFWFRRIPPHIYALLRITLGGAGLVSLIGLGDMSLWSLDGGLVPDYGLMAVKATLKSWDLGAEAGLALYLACVVAFVAMAVGFRSRVSVPAALVMQLVELSWNALPLSGSHQVMQSMLFCLMWADCGTVWSLDAWLARRRRPAAESGQVPPPVSIAPLRLLQCQIALIYLAAGLWKLDDPTWRDGSAVHYVLNHNEFHRFPNTVPDSLEWLATIATYSTILWELSFAFMVWYTPTRRVALVIGVLMHLGMLGLMEVGPFHLVMLAGYPAFLEPQQFLRLLGRTTKSSVEADIAISP